ncbi:DUF4394 domain-containing protein [Candidatus Gracilibacteria bacterium]|nr:DUF4394 domain-containing protein [Candidatus Gracilibacteria bacterium]
MFKPPHALAARSFACYRSPHYPCCCTIHSRQRLDKHGFFLLTDDNRIAGLTDALPNQPATPVDLVGVAAGETIVGIDVRPQNGKLYGLGVDAVADTATLYHINPQNGQATALGLAGQVVFVDDSGNPINLPDPATTGYGVDFNPALDRLRVVTASGLNFRVNPNSGAPVDGSATLAGINLDGLINGGTTSVDATAYTNNVANNGNVTTQYTLDPISNSLFIQNPPNAGTQTLPIAVTLGGSPLGFTSTGGFDIPAGVNASASNQAVSMGAAFAVLTVGGVVGLYEIDLVNGQAALLGTPGDLAVRGLAVWESPALGNVLSDDGQSIIRFRLDTPGTITTQALVVASLVIGEQLVAIDARPQTGQLYGLAVDATGDTATLYLIDPQTGSLTAVGGQSGIAFVDETGAEVDLPNASAGYGLDFNPTVDRVRVTTGSGLNFRVNPNSGAPVDGNAALAGINPDGALNGLPLGSTGTSATAYTNAYAQPLTGGVTSQYTLDAASNALFIQTPPNAGTQTNTLALTLGGAPLDFGDVNGFDIPPGASVITSGIPATGNAYAALSVGGVSGIYQLDLATGAVTSSGVLGAGTGSTAGLVAWSDAPTAALTATTTVSESVGTVDVIITATGGTAMVAGYSVGNGSATPGDDYTVISGTVVLGGSVISQTISLPINDDTLVEATKLCSSICLVPPVFSKAGYGPSRIMSRL